MGAQNTLARFADPSGGFIFGRSYLGRIRSSASLGVNASSTVDNIDLYAEGSLDVGHPFATLSGIGHAFGGYTDQLQDLTSGAPINGLFCVVDFAANGNFSINFYGIHFAWFEYVPSNPAAGSPAAWRMVAKGGIEQIIQCSPEPFTPCEPFEKPFGARQCLDPQPWEVVHFLKPGQPVFVSAVGNGGISQRWREEYQACASDDTNNDSPAGIRSAWNYLSSNCCKSVGGEDDGGLGDPDDGPPPPPPGDCSPIPLTCAMIVKLCHLAGAPDYHVWCVIDGFDYCISQTGGSCQCDTGFDVNGDPVPDPNTLPPGTIILIRCASFVTPHGWRKCSQLPAAGNPWCA